MKKICLILIIILATVNVNKATAQFQQGTNAVNMGIGIGSTFVSGYASASPGIALSFEHGQWGNMGPGTISLGGYLGYESFNYRFPDNISGHTSYIILGARGAYHYTGFEDKKWDPYAGLMLSVAIASSNIDYVGYSHPALIIPSLYIGSRYYLSDQWAVNGEIGFGITALTLGVSYRF